MSPDEYARTMSRLRKQRRLEYARGLRGPNIPADVVRDIISGYLDEGWTSVVIGESVGISCRTVELIVAGECATVRQATHKALSGLSRAGMLRTARPDAFVPNTGAKRRLRALHVMGWSWPALAEHGPRFHSRTIADGQLITAATHRRVVDLYDELWDTAGPSLITRRRAVARGWLPPQAWDDDTIDDPSATPHVDTERPRAIDALIEDVTELLAAGETGEGIAWRLGRRLTSMQDQLRSAGRHDLARALRGEVAS